MKNIWTRQFRLLSDHMEVYQFLLDIYDKDLRCSVAAPFWEYALSSTWMDISYTFLNRLWFDGDKIVGFVFYESPITDIYFSLHPGYEELAEEMVEYAGKEMPDFNGEQRLVLLKDQNAIAQAAAKLGYHQVDENTDMEFDFDTALDYPLPAGFRFVPYEEQDETKRLICCWKGFDHEESKGPWRDDNVYVNGTTWTPANARKNTRQILQAPHQTCRYDIVIANEQDEYVCYAGMWWVPENQLAYMEPLCTVPEYRRKGLAAAALSELYRRMKALGATHMTGGANPFYKAIGYQRSVIWTYWKK